MKLIVGLGNPGVRYSGTRHNAGRDLAGHIGKSEGLKWSQKKSLQASLAETCWDDQKIFLARPETFMNLSGEPVSLLVRHFSLDPAQDLLIVVDDVALPFGKLRLRRSGSDGGHNGLKSISQRLTTTDYPRLRIGIALLRPVETREDMAAFVLRPFEAEEKKAFPAVLEKAFDACRLWAGGSFAEAMNAVNPDSH